MSFMHISDMVTVVRNILQCPMLFKALTWVTHKRGTWRRSGRRPNPMTASTCTWWTCMMTHPVIASSVFWCLGMIPTWTQTMYVHMNAVNVHTHERRKCTYTYIVRTVYVASCAVLRFYLLTICTWFITYVRACGCRSLSVVWIKH